MYRDIGVKYTKLEKNFKTHHSYDLYRHKEKNCINSMEEVEYLEDIVKEMQDMRNLDWAERKISPGTPGCFLKAHSNVNDTRVYYKLSNYDSYRGIFGHECVNELIASRLLDILGIPHVKYKLIHSYVKIGGQEIKTWICASENFKKQDEVKMAFDMFYDLEKQENESPLEFAVRYGWGQYIYRMFLVDYLVANRDRHGGNVEVLKTRNTNSVRLAPLFDHGVSLFFSCYGNAEELRNFKVMKDIQANNFFGSRSLEYNLGLIPKEYLLEITPLKETDKEYLLNGLSEVITSDHMGKIWEMIWKRWCHYEAETICDKRRF